MLVIVSDSHGAVDRLEKLLETCLKEGWPMAHAGDGVVDGIVDLFRKFSDVKVWFSRGNCDMDQALMRELTSLHNVEFANVITFNFDGQVFGMSHYDGVAEDKLYGKKVDVWIHGHTHKAAATRRGDSVMVNPGALYEDAKYILWDPRAGAGERRFFDK